MRPRAVFADADAAHTVVSRLRADGFEAEVGKVHFAGEDDDEDHAWAVSTDAPAIVLELLAEQHEGWLEADEAPGPSVAPPLDLPNAPRRTKGHWSS